MRVKCLIGLSMTLLAAGAASQTGTVPLDSGTAPSGLINSNITVSNGSVGIGTTNPGAKLDIENVNSQVGIQIGGNASSYTGSDLGITRSSSATGVGEAPDIQFNDTGSGSYNIIQGSSGGLQFFNAYSSGNWTERMRIASSGSVGIGTTNPSAPLDVRNTTASKTAGGFSALASFYSDDPTSPFGLSMTFIGASTLVNRTLSLQSQDANLANGGNIALQPAAGNVGIGTTSPEAKLEINGGLRFSGDAAGTVQTTAWTGVLCGGDYAESVGVAGDRKNYEPGDLIVVDPENPDNFKKSSQPYSTLVAGIYSTKPGAVGKRSPASTTAAEIPMAMIGIVPAKVSGENGPVRPGDLLVTSSTVGYAMKGTDSTRLTGAVVGKALGQVLAGKAVIDVLVTLQ